MRPPNLSVHMPSGRRISEPVSTGVAASRPNWVSLRPSTFLIGMPMTANIIHTAKQTVKAIVLSVTTETCCRLTVEPILRISLRSNSETRTQSRLIPSAKTEAQSPLYRTTSVGMSECVRTSTVWLP